MKPTRIAGARGLAFSGKAPVGTTAIHSSDASTTTVLIMRMQGARSRRMPVRAARSRKTNSENSARVPWAKTTCGHAAAPGDFRAMAIPDRA
jgi:hypothetical protein